LKRWSASASFALSTSAAANTGRIPTIKVMSGSVKLPIELTGPTFRVDDS
jgi:hypothetical protein